MTTQQSTAGEHPPAEREERQRELEDWCRSVGGQRATRAGWEKAAAGMIVNRVATPYLLKVREVYQHSRKRVGKQAHVWSMLHSQDAVDQVALECLIFVLGNVAAREESSYLGLAGLLGKRAEYALWLSNPAWGKGLHLKGLRLAGGSDLSMGLMCARLRAKGFAKAAHYIPLDRVQRSALGAIFIEIIAEATKLVEIRTEPSGRNRTVRRVVPTPLYWEFMNRWRDAAMIARPAYLPMLCPPRPWRSFTGGGYLSIRVQAAKVAWRRWPELARRMRPVVWDAMNRLQDTAYRIDRQQLTLARQVWDVGHSFGGMPSRHELPRPNRREAENPSEFWRLYWDYRADRRLASARSRWVLWMIAAERMGTGAPIWFTHQLDNRGRIYARSSGLNPQGGDLYRSQLLFDHQAPLKGHEGAFAWSLGEALGLPADALARTKHLEGNSELIGRVGENPSGYLGFLAGAGEPWRAAQLCRDWAGYLADPSYTSGTIHWRDQTCSGWGHVACLTRDRLLALHVNVTGQKRGDLYEAVGKRVMREIKAAVKGDELITDRTRDSLRWWLAHEPPRSLWKAVLMPVIYGRTFRSLADEVERYLRDEYSNFLIDELRVVDLASAMSQAANNAIKREVPRVRELSHWLAAVAKLQIDHGQRPWWYTPNGLAVEAAIYDTGMEDISLNLCGRRVRIVGEYEKPTIDARKTNRKITPDFIHSFDAAFLQQFVGMWDGPISAVHDCFGVPLDRVAELQRELREQWAIFYSADHLTRHQGMVAAALGCAVPNPPIVGTLDVTELGQNPHLFS